MANDEELIPHLFRNEYSKIVAVLSRRFGFEQVEIAEDIASETFLTAAQTWSLDGIPKHPTAWLYSVAKNKAKNYLHRKGIYEGKVMPEIKVQADGDQHWEIDLSPENISDSQLQMMFIVCHPAIPPESQIGLSLRILCGFSIDEITSAFLTNKETINKRLFRAREKLRDENIRMELPAPSEIDHRLETVLRTIYLLFNEGYYSFSQDKKIRKDLCLEAMRMCNILIESKDTNKPPVNALMALMCFHASRLDARVSADGEVILYDEQDIAMWNLDLINKGAYFLHTASTGDKLSRYHLEAGIAYWNTQKADSQEKWQHILQLYNQLLQIEYSPIAALNRTYALFKTGKVAEAIEEAENLRLTSNPLYFALLGELYSGINVEKAIDYYQQALQHAKAKADQQQILKRIERLESQK